MGTPSEYFALFLTALRTSGSDIPLSDAACATMVASALDILSPEHDDVATTATSMSIDLEELVEGGCFATDNGTNPEDDTEEEEDDDGDDD